MEVLAETTHCKGTIGTASAASVGIGYSTSGLIGLLTGPHQTFFSDPSSFTILLSRGDRPVFAPEYAVSAPDDVIAEPVS